MLFHDFYTTTIYGVLAVLWQEGKTPPRITHCAVYNETFIH